ncbi:hypothetical protein MKW98_004106 [Papaver atlanticum]|uniref:Uncharacterized protein n=1 Tax=Papaver atlanticum TaxID=357466 RepID=A0AAD4T0X8_9MAGN|nr:hypothetical protein MKW98_004106 [Papaver atlanticum]
MQSRLWRIDFMPPKQKWVLTLKKKVHFPPHLRKFTSEIRSLKTYFDDVVDFGEYFVKSGGRSFTEYEDLCYPLTYDQGRIAKHMSDEDAASAVIAENLADITNQQEALHCLESSQSVEVRR